MTKSDRGFTLVELLVVVVVIGIMTGVAVAVFFDVSENARRQTDNANVRILNSASMLLSVKTETPLADVFGGIASDAGRLQHLWAERLLVEIPEPAQSGAAFVWDQVALKWTIGINGAGNLLANANWAEGLTGWDTGSGLSAAAGSLQSSGGWLRQWVDNITPGVSYTLEFDGRAEGSVRRWLVQITWYDQQNSVLSPSPSKGITPTASWQTITLNGAAPAAAVRARVEVLRGLELDPGTVVYVRNPVFRPSSL